MTNAEQWILGFAICIRPKFCRNTKSRFEILIELLNDFCFDSLQIKCKFKSRKRNFYESISIKSFDFDRQTQMGQAMIEQKSKQLQKAMRLICRRNWIWHLETSIKEIETVNCIATSKIRFSFSFWSYKERRHWRSLTRRKMENW